MPEFEFEIPGLLGIHVLLLAKEHPTARSTELPRDVIRVCLPTVVVMLFVGEQKILVGTSPLRELKKEGQAMASFDRLC